MSMASSGHFSKEEDFFTKISFSTLIGELNIEPNHWSLHELTLKKYNSCPAVKI